MRQTVAASSWVRLALLSTALFVLKAAQAQPTPGVPAPGKLHLTAPQPLNPTELLAVQAIGGSVLQARVGSKKNPDISQTLTELQRLRETIETNLALRASPPAIMNAGVHAEHNQVSGRAAAVPAYGAPSIDTTASAAIQTRLESLHQARLHLQTAPAGIKDASALAQRRALASRVAELEVATASALKAPAQDRFRQLYTLRERLQVRSLREQLSADSHAGSASPDGTGPAQQETPTLITLIHHR